MIMDIIITYNNESNPEDDDTREATQQDFDKW